MPALDQTKRQLTWTIGRAASGGALALQPLLTIRHQPESIRNFRKSTFSPGKNGLSLYRKEKEKNKIWSLLRTLVQPGKIGEKPVFSWGLSV